MTRILVVDDEPDILELVRQALGLRLYVVETADNPAHVALEKLGSYDLILLDIMMPGTDGLTFCQQIRPLVDCPILFLTAKDQESDVVMGLAQGADDYVKKPFGIQELLARVDAHLRREKREKKTLLVMGNIQFDLAAKRMTIDGESLSLTKSEYEICLYLARHKGRVFSKEQLYEHLYGFDERGTPQAVAEHIKNIRAKLRAYGCQPIETVWGIGYKWQ